MPNKTKRLADDYVINNAIAAFIKTNKEVSFSSSNSLSIILTDKEAVMTVHFISACTLVPPIMHVICVMKTDDEERTSVIKNWNDESGLIFDSGV